MTETIEATVDTTETDHAGLLDAVLAVQAEAPTVKKTAANPAFKGSRYAPLDEIVETIQPILVKHGLVWMTLPIGSHDAPALEYRLAHASTGEVIQGVMPLLLSKHDPQGQGSAITYARRYALCAVLNLVADVDDDGNQASAPASQQAAQPTARDDMLPTIRTLIRRNNVKTQELRVMLRGAGLKLTDKDNPKPLVAQLTEEQAGKVIDFLQSPIPEPAAPSDVPAPAPDDFVHEPAEQDGTLPFDPSVPA